MRRLLERHDRPDETIYYGPDDVEIDRAVSRVDIEHALALEKLRHRGHWHRWGPITMIAVVLGVILIVAMLVGLPAWIEIARLGVEEKLAELAIAKEKGDASKWSESQVILMVVCGLLLALILKGWKN